MIVNLATAATATLALFSGRNIIQTIQVARQETPQHDTLGDLFQPTDSTETVVSKIQLLKRKQLLQLYFDSRGPKDMKEIEGEWDGCLLDNQSWIMTAITSLLTDRLFGMGRRWNGKQFGVGPQLGINRFYPRQSTSSGAMETEHTFDMKIRASKLGKTSENSLVLGYTKYQFPLSLWRTMMDEIRVVPLEGKARVLIGLGYMAWSGGRWNCSPFLLYRNDKPTNGPTEAAEKNVEDEL